MKNMILMILTALTTSAFADSSIQMPPYRQGWQFTEEVPVVKRGFYYVRFTAVESDLVSPESILPGLGIGYRRLAGNGAADISLSGIGHAARKGNSYLWTAPKGSYIHYLKPDGKQSAYVGGGLAWGGVDVPERDFIGLIPSAIFGYEFAHQSPVLGFAELTISQPAIALSQHGAFPGPILEVSTGIGF